MPDTAPLVVPLAAASDRSQVGGKAAELSRLMAAGFSVPDGFVITTAAFRLASDDGGRVPQPVREALRSALATHPGPLAYRSSAIAEDLAAASFAGQYESVLDVRGLEAGLRALQTCWDSARVDHLATYRDTMAGETADGMAVLVHGMVDADVAGVAFGADPVTGAQRTIIEATHGVGERLLAGELTPERWIVEAGEVVHVDRLDSGPVLTDERALEIARLCERIDRIYGQPQDIEWAVAGGTLHLLQSRPITALPVEPAERPPKGQTWELSDGFFPEPVLPLSYSTWLPRHSEAWARVFRNFGVPVHTVGHGRWFGRVYDRLIPLGEPAKDRPLPPRLLLKLGVRLMPSFRRRLSRARKAIEDDRLMAVARDWESGGRARLRSENRRLLDTDLGTLDDPGLADHLQAVLDHVLAAGIAHFEVAAASFAAAGWLGIVMEELLGWKPERVGDLLQGYGEASIEDGKAIQAAAEAVRADPNGTALLEDLGRLLDDPGPVGRSVRAFLDVAGHRSVGQDLSQQTWREDPTPVISLIRHRLAHEEDRPDPRAGAARAEAEARATITDPKDWARFSAALERARHLRPYQDETEPDVAAACGLVRYVALEAARRLLARGAIERADDVFYLETGELLSALRTGRIGADIERRRAEHRWALANPAPRLLGPEPSPPPSIDVFPRDVMPIVGAFLWAVDNAVRPPKIDPADDGAIRGLPASPGRATGPVRVIRTPAEFDRVRAGDIVVCTMTMAAWSPIFPIISGLITERGGPLSHPATLAREYGLPAVLGVVGATATFTDGQWIMIDGGTGIVEVALSPAG